MLARGVAAESYLGASHAVEVVAAVHSLDNIPVNSLMASAIGEASLALGPESSLLWHRTFRAQALNH